MLIELTNRDNEKFLLNSDKIMTVKKNSVKSEEIELVDFTSIKISGQKRYIAVQETPEQIRDTVNGFGMELSSLKLMILMSVIVIVVNLLKILGLIVKLKMMR